MSMSPSRAEFSVSYDRTTSIISVVCCALLLLVAVAIQSVLAGCVSLLIVALAYAYSPRGYTLSARSLIVRRRIGSVSLSLEGVREARRTTGDDLRGCIRLWGSGGLFGYYGLFRTTKLGKCWWYVTNRRNAVVVITGRKTTVFSPDDVDGFLAAIRAAVRVPETPAEQLAGAVESHRTGIPAGAGIGAAVAVVALVAGAFAVLYSPGPPTYTLTPNALTIHDRFYPVTLNASDVDVSHIRVVDITADKDWRPTMRTNGFANAHYRSGWFRVTAGCKVRMYRADATQLVLLPPRHGGVAVLLEVREPNGFLEEVRRAWASQ
jgi:hypothetical protein